MSLAVLSLLPEMPTVTYSPGADLNNSLTRCPEVACKQEIAPAECRVLLVSAPEELQVYLEVSCW